MAVHEQDVAADMTESLPEEKIRICLFSMKQGAYAVPADVLTEISIPPKIFPVPATPSYVLGVINLRGAITPIVDTSPVPGLPQQSAPGCILVVSPALCRRHSSIRRTNSVGHRAAGGADPRCEALGRLLSGAGQAVGAGS